ncbi:hypothetical protein O7626_39765 [Micromonospora sp. WMMD1102]|uniref:hypothetical protein n=1 Tax=Micromonospora sp. WMMD1102 TaxID=3016105 RepID=UPI00241513D4|nr:hypothetical protein [Micromonospora sp. WMMD1102]MDG4791953.1 hypothetical protein [Micromonospora sp. WMMD1102]
MTVPWENAQFEPWTPVDAENALRWVLRAMHEASQGLRMLRDEEVAAKHTFEAARRRAFFADDRPKPTRGGHTVADRDAYIERETAPEREAYELATTAKEAAQDHLRTLNSQSVLAEQVARFGEVRDVAPLPAGDHTRIGPFTELAMHYPGLPVTPVVVDGAWD